MSDFSARDKTIALIGAIALTLLIVSGIGYAVLAQRPVDSFAPSLLAFSVPVITTLLVGAGFKRELGEVHDKVNGNYETLQNQNAELQTVVTQLLAALPTDVTARVVNTGAIPIITDEDLKGRHSK